MESLKDTYKRFYNITKDERTDQTSDELISRHKSGDKVAIAALYVKHYPLIVKVYSDAKSFFNDADFNSDCIDTMLKTIEQYDPEHGTAYNSYLQTALLNMVCNHLDKLKAKKRDAVVLSLTDLQTETDDGGFIEFELPIDVDYDSSVNVYSILSTIDLTANERAYVDYIINANTLGRKDGTAGADFADSMGFTRQYVNKLKRSLKVKLYGLLT
jgi:hypothetical protein